MKTLLINSLSSKDDAMCLNRHIGCNLCYVGITQLILILLMIIVLRIYEINLKRASDFFKIFSPNHPFFQSFVRFETILITK